MADTSTKGSGWITFSGIMLILAGLVSIVDAVWAFRYNDTLVDLVLFENSLTAWGWIWLIVGVVLMVAGTGVFQKSQWARWTGIGAASLALLSNLSWAQAQPQQALIGAFLSTMVIYGLAVYGEE